ALPINRSRVAFGVSDVAIGVEHLHLDQAHQEHAAVAPALAAALDTGILGPLDVKLAIAKPRAGLDVAGLGHHLEYAVLDRPLGGVALLDSFPVREIFSIKQDNGVGGGLAWLFR